MERTHSCETDSRKTRRFPSPRAFTAIELMVVVAIVGLLAALILPAVQSAREAARSASCKNNLKQLALGALVYHSAHSCLPMGRSYVMYPGLGMPGPCGSYLVDRSYLASILPYVDQGPLYNSINQVVSIFSAGNETVRSSLISTYVCPSDPAAGRIRMGFVPLGVHLGWQPTNVPAPLTSTSYVGVRGNGGDSWYANPECTIPAGSSLEFNGCITDVAPITLASISDGASLTLLITERSITASERLDLVIDNAFPEITYANIFGWWFSGGDQDSMGSTYYSPNLYKRMTPTDVGGAVNNATAWFVGPSSLHPGGLHVALADGSVRFVKETIDSWPMNLLTGNPEGVNPRGGVWQALGSRNGGEIIGADSY
jgi:prepilin-type N-terminal cleavage/methylation domain-containing protein/prepilin-type processing-associated H-X9-DG protein